MSVRPFLGIIVGLQAEARYARPLGGLIGIGGGGRTGAQSAAEQLVQRGVSGLISFGLAGGLDPSLRPGTILVPRCIISDGETHDCDPGLLAMLGGTGHTIYGGSNIRADRAAKARLFAKTQASAIDLESGAVVHVARAHALPFAALRTICDPAERDLPPAALLALDTEGGIGFCRIMLSVLRQPSQLPALLQLALDAARAHRNVLSHINGLIIPTAL